MTSKARHRLRSDDSRQRVQESRVFLVQADGDAQMVRHAVTGDRSDNHTKAQQLRRTRAPPGRLRSMHRKLPPERMYSTPS